jgi:hypothetical protein
MLSHGDWGATVFNAGELAPDWAEKNGYQKQVQNLRREVSLTGEYHIPTKSRGLSSLNFFNGGH